MSGERDLSTILAGLRVKRREGIYVYVFTSSADAISGAAAMIQEGEGTTYVFERSVAERLGLAWSFTAAWLTVEVHTSLEAVGVTAVLTEALGAAGIPCNVLAGFCHDHLLVPVERADDALAALESVHQ